jgi:hypothetical protein
MKRSALIRFGSLADAKSYVEYQVIGVSSDGRTWPSPWVRGH